MDYINVTIRPMTKEDLPSVMEIERLCFINPWNEEQFIYEIEENVYSNPWVVELSNTNSDNVAIVGFCVYWQTFDSATICQIAVHPEIQRRQLGSAMMDEIINDCYAKRVQTLTLEVRKSNTKAINFYLKHGFEQVTVKEKYYTDGEDAIYMTRRVDIF
ncbi:MAG: ribosomal protein S18-alanine N-acetyltransferase [Bacilli bacterium]|nr:ribosomal protein S18-alanine N-acetyltransferase [Bacilli bacterium]